MSRICIVFAGREDRMQILMHYLNKALNEKKLDEIHLWNYSRNDSDTTWVNSLKSDKIKIFTSDDRTKIDYENGGSSWKVDNFSLVWKEYTKEIYEDSLFVKMDDDIVYVDITKFDEIFDFVKNNDTLWTTPIIVNNSLTINTTNFMEVIGAGDKIVDIINDHKAAELMHELFINNKLKNTIFSMSENSHTHGRHKDDEEDVIIISAIGTVSYKFDDGTKHTLEPGDAFKFWLGETDRYYTCQFDFEKNRWYCIDIKFPEF